jgi:hypothetical protein
MNKIFNNKAIMIISLIIGIIGYAYIMVFRRPGVLEVLVLIFLTLVVRVSAYFLNKNYNRFRIFDFIYPIIITLLLFFGMNR